tara:strand:- start:210 stop:452 length:243 start_codon:yes stop_codon:yes gene_type:complete
VKTKGINRKVISLLTQLSDNKQLDIRRNKHIKLTGIFGGKKRVFTLAGTPSRSYYEQSCRSQVRRFIASLDLNQPIQLPI